MYWQWFVEPKELVDVEGKMAELPLSLFKTLFESLLDQRVRDALFKAFKELGAEDKVFMYDDISILCGTAGLRVVRDGMVVAQMVIWMS